jgi:hypothetical protein
MSPLWGDEFSTAIVGLPSLSDTQFTDEAWIEWSKRALIRNAEPAQVTKPNPNLLCVRSSGDEIQMFCRSKEGMVLSYKGATNQSEEAIKMLLESAPSDNL